jgi:diguanylate cyclase (GGDEF)-like protein/PAS domain S-box-containing protein
MKKNYIIFMAGALYIIVMTLTINLVLFSKNITSFFKEIIFIGITCVFLFILIIIMKKIKSKTENFYEKVVENAPILMCIRDIDGNIVMSNETYKNIFSKDGKEITGLNIKDIINKRDIETIIKHDRIVIERGEKLEIEERTIINGVEKYFDSIKYPILDSKKNIVGLGVVAIDITDIKKERDKIYMNTTVFDSVKDGIFLTEIDGTIINVNMAFIEITGFDKNEILGKSPSIMKSEKHSDLFYKEMWQRLEKRGEWKGEIWNKRKNGEIYPAFISISSIKDEKERFLNYIAILEDLTTVKESENSIEKLSNFDLLTGFPNQILFKDRLEQAIIHGRKHGDMFTILQIDIDNFKLINDSFGYTTGDLLIKKAAERINKRVGEFDTISRISGDEFIIIIQELKKIEEAAIIAQNLINDFKSPFEIEEKEIFVTVSIGITVYPEDGEESEKLMKNSNAALRYSKNQGRSNYQFYSQELNRESFERLEMESALRHAMEKEEFILYYQPQVDIENGNIIGMEALIRWEHPYLGMISPAKFIPVAEETGIIVDLGEWVLYTACMQNKLWQEQGYKKINVSVNLSPLQIKQPDIIEVIKKILETTELSPEYLELEITEGVLMSHSDEILKKIEKIKSLGIKIAIDDFGTGYSSLSYLKKFPMDKLKIDQCFVRDIPDNDNGAIAKVVIGLAKSLNMKVIAEGVETKEQVEFLKKNGCEEIQGYYYGRPMHPLDFENRLKQE